MKFLNIEVDNITFSQAVERICQMVEQKQGGYVVTPNVDHIVKLETDDEFREAYRSASLVLTDGQPLIWISRLYGTPIKEKISGSDLFPAICKASAQNGYRIFLLGSQKSISLQAVNNLRKQYPEIKICGRFSPCPGYETDPEKTEQLWKKIKSAKTDILFVFLGTPKQEIFLNKNRSQLGQIVALGLGGTLDFASGKTKRAPVWMQKCGLEWFYRFLKEPRRLFRRYLIDDPKIIALIFRYLPKK